MSQAGRSLAHNYDKDIHDIGNTSAKPTQYGQ
jgi:hypothetical protein